jgi:hypothetical protein
VHFVLGDSFCFYWSEGSEANVQSDETDMYATSLQLVEQRFGEVKAGGWRSNGAWRPGEDGLIAIVVAFEILRTANVRGQGNFPDLGKFAQDVFCSLELKVAMALFICFENHGADVCASGVCVIDSDASPDARAFAGAHHGPPIVGRDFFQ